MVPNLSVGLAGDAKILDGNDTYITSLADSSETPRDQACVYIRVGRSLQPLGYAGFNVTADPA